MNNDLFHIDTDRYNEFITYDNFPFDKHQCIVKMNPLNKVLSINALRAFKAEISQHMYHLACFRNAVIAARYFESLGYDVDVVEGRYKVDERRFKKDFPFRKPNSQWMTHRWLRINGKHVDVSIECAGDGCKTHHFLYKSERLYDADDLFAFGLKTGNDCGTDEIIWCSSLDGMTYNQFDKPTSWSLVNEQGDYVCLKNRVKIVA